MPASKKAATKARGKKPGLYANIHAKQERIAHGSGERMRKADQKGAPSAHAFQESASKTTAKKAARKAPSKAATKKSPTKRASRKAAKKKTAE